MQLYLRARKLLKLETGLFDTNIVYKRVKPNQSSKVTY
uniref:Uncharacterized protein n=1 Tax=Arundo donax TaxID=35708 RepID=A0A0A9BUH1_ARUDO